MRLVHVPMVMAPLAIVVLAASGYGARFGVWDWRFGFQLARWGFYACLAAAALALVTLAVPRVRSGHLRGLVAAAVIGIGGAYLPWHMLQNARALPSINDITTDPDDAPAFVAIVPLRADAPVPTAYAGSETGAKQRNAYPDIRPIDLALPPAAAFARALDAAKGFGWEIVAADAASGRIEATATTPWFGFRDDVVIRVRPTAGGSRIDVRSLSRVGKSDLGANAARIRAYAAKLAG
jgi:uncharacterized protein (DUF1499 family)